MHYYLLLDRLGSGAVQRDATTELAGVDYGETVKPGNNVALESGMGPGGSSPPPENEKYSPPRLFLL